MPYTDILYHGKNCCINFRKTAVRRRSPQRHFGFSIHPSLAAPDRASAEAGQDVPNSFVPCGARDGRVWVAYSIPSAWHDDINVGCLAIEDMNTKDSCDNERRAGTEAGDGASLKAGRRARRP